MSAGELAVSAEPGGNRYDRPVSTITVNGRVRADLGDIAALAESIRALGLLQPVVVLPDGRLVAGLRRLEAVKLLGWHTVAVYEAATLDGALAETLAQRDENTCRKDFTVSEGLAIGALIEGLERDEATERKRQGRPPRVSGANLAPDTRNDDLTEGSGQQETPPAASAKESPTDRKTATKAAKAAGMSRGSYQKAKKVQKAAASPDPAVAVAAAKAMAEMDRTGNVSTAYRNVLAAQRAAQDRDALLASLPQERPAPALLHCTCAELAGLVEPGAVDAVVTDPPYGREHLGVYDELAATAAKLVRPGGLVLVMTGQYHLPEVMRRLAARLEYWWTFAYLTPGDATKVWPRNLQTQWKPVLAYRQPGGPAPSFTVRDVITSPAKDNGSHSLGWSQSAEGLRQMVEIAADPGELVCDPFLGAGSTALACLAAGRRFTGCDSDLACVEQVRAAVAG